MPHTTLCAVNKFKSAACVNKHLCAMSLSSRVRVYVRVCAFSDTRPVKLLKCRFVKDVETLRREVNSKRQNTHSHTHIHTQMWIFIYPISHLISARYSNRLNCLQVMRQKTLSKKKLQTKIFVNKVQKTVRMKCAKVNTIVLVPVVRCEKNFSCKHCLRKVQNSADSSE